MQSIVTLQLLQINAWRNSLSDWLQIFDLRQCFTWNRKICIFGL